MCLHKVPFVAKMEKNEGDEGEAELKMYIHLLYLADGLIQSDFDHFYPSR